MADMYELPGVYNELHTHWYNGKQTVSCIYMYVLFALFKCVAVQIYNSYIQIQ